MSDGFNPDDPFADLPDLSAGDLDALRSSVPAEPRAESHPGRRRWPSGNFRRVRVGVLPNGEDAVVDPVRTAYEGQVHKMRIPSVRTANGNVVANLGGDTLMKIRRQALGMTPHVHSAYCSSPLCRGVATLRRTVRFLIGRTNKDGLLA